MRVLLVDADSKAGFPNLALMKISAHHKRRGDTVDLIKGIPDSPPLGTYDCIYLSCIFFQNAERSRQYLKQVDSDAVVFGGSGFLPDSDVRLGHDIEHILPDYSLYNIDFSLGFTSRGCIRSCPWCIVPAKEGKIKDHAPVSEFLHPDHEKVVLLDNNFQASPRWRENLQFIIDHDLKVNFNQGLDARLVNVEFAAMLASSKYYNWTFKARGVHLAFDTMRAERPLLRALGLFQDAGMRAKEIMVYILVGFDTTHEEDRERVETVIRAGAKPYIMRYNQLHDPYLRNLARWVNRKYYEFIPFENYLNGVLVEVGA